MVLDLDGARSGWCNIWMVLFIRMVLDQGGIESGLCKIRMVLDQDSA